MHVSWGFEQCNSIVRADEAMRVNTHPMRQLLIVLPYVIAIRLCGLAHAGSGPLCERAYLATERPVPINTTGLVIPLAPALIG